jgi:hypothetical protein
MEKPGLVLVMRNGNDCLKDRAWSHLEGFMRERKCWKRQRERVEEVCWSDAEIRTALRDAGFGRVQAWDAAPFFRNEGAVARGCRTIYLANKPGPARNP